MAVLYTPHFIQFLDSNGNPLSGGKLYTYSAGTTTPKATYTTAAGTVQNANPVVLDSSGRAVVFIDGSYKFVLKDSNDVTIETTDNVSSFNALATTLPCVDAGGSVDAITATYSPAITLDDKLIVTVVSAGRNTTTTPTFTPNSLSTRTITKNGGQALAVGDTGGAGYVMMLEYNATNTRWELLNPAFLGSGTQGDIIYCSSSNTWSKLPAGTNGYILMTQGASANPTWANAFSGYRNIFSVGGTYVAGGAGTYQFAGDGNILRATDSGISSNVFTPLLYLDPADYPSIGALTTKLRIRAQILINDVAPTGSFTIGLYPFTRPATSGGANTTIITLGTVVSGSDGCTISSPSADSSNNLVGSDFDIPAAGWYTLGVVTTATAAVSSQVAITAQLQLRNS